MDLFTYLMAKNGHNTSIHEDLFSYLLGKAQGGGGEIKTATGITINIPDAKKLVSFMMTKESTQDGEPTPDNPVPVNVVEGYRNLFDKSNANLQSAYISSGNLYRTSTGNVRTLIFPATPNKTYTILKESTSIFRVGYTETLPQNNDTVYGIVNAETGIYATITVGNNAQYLLCYVRGNDDNITDQELLDSIMIVEGDQELPYVPYGSNYILYKQVGKNLFDKDNAVVLNNRVINETTGQIEASSGWKVTENYAPIEALKTYTFTGNISGGTNNERIFFYDKNNNYLGFVRQPHASKFTFTTLANTASYRLQGSSINVDNLELVQGSTATSYEAYQEINVPIPLNNNIIAGIGDYKDELMVDKSGHCWLNKKMIKIILNENTSDLTSVNKKTNSTYFQYRNPIFENISSSSLPNAFCNYLSGFSADDLYATDNVGFTFSSVGNLRFNLLNNVASTVEELKTWLSTHNLIVWGALATPQQIDLNTTVDLKLFKGVNNITNSEDGYMTIEYVSEEEA